MKCRVLLFAQLAETLGAREITLELPAGTTVGEALDRLAVQHDAVRVMRDRVAIAVDERYVEESVVLPDGGEMALIPPVSGG